MERCSYPGANKDSQKQTKTKPAEKRIECTISVRAARYAKIKRHDLSSLTHAIKSLRIVLKWFLHGQTINSLQIQFKKR